MIGKINIITLFALLGVALSMGKCSFLIAGFNTMSKEEKEKYDTKSLCKYMGKVMFGIAFCITLFVLSDVLVVKAIFNVGLALFIFIIIFTIFYTNTGNRFIK